MGGSKSLSFESSCELRRKNLLFRHSTLSAGIEDHHASGREIKKLFDAIDAHHMTMDADGKRYIDLAELTVFFENKGANAE